MMTNVKLLQLGILTKSGDLFKLLQLVCLPCKDSQPNKQLKFSTNKNLQNNSQRAIVESRNSRVCNSRNLCVDSLVLSAVARRKRVLYFSEYVLEFSHEGFSK